MRKLTKGNKLNFLVFAIIIIFIIAILIVFLKLALGMQKREYILDRYTFLCDEDNVPIELEETTKMKEQWNGKFYLDINDETYKLGNPVVAFDSNTANISLYGKFYEIYFDGSITKFSGNITIDDSSKDKFYKLDDRKYLLISSQIKNESGILNTTNYLLVILDKAGNTLLLNNELNAKTIKPIILEAKTFKFDVANEKLIFDGGEINLKKVLGSTNQYQEIKIDDSKEDDKNKNNTTELPPVQNGGSTTIIENEGDTTQINANIINENKSQAEENNTPLEKSVSLRHITTASTYLDIDYVISDPENKYQTVYITIEGDKEQIIALDKEQTSYRVTGLTPNSNYKVILATKELTLDNEIIDNIEDILDIKTTKISTELAIIKIAMQKIYFTLKMDSNYAFDSGDIVLYVDGQEEDRISINPEQAVSSSGWSETLDYSYGQEIILRIENVIYNGKSITTDIEAKIKNY